MVPILMVSQVLWKCLSTITKPQLYYTCVPWSPLCCDQPCGACDGQKCLYLWMVMLPSMGGNISAAPIMSLQAWAAKRGNFQPFSLLQQPNFSEESMLIKVKLKEDKKSTTCLCHSSQNLMTGLVSIWCKIKQLYWITKTTHIKGKIQLIRWN